MLSSDSSQSSTDKERGKGEQKRNWPPLARSVPWMGLLQNRVRVIKQRGESTIWARRAAYLTTKLSGESNILLHKKISILSILIRAQTSLQTHDRVVNSTDIEFRQHTDSIFMCVSFSSLNPVDERNVMFLLQSQKKKKRSPIFNPCLKQ